MVDQPAAPNDPNEPATPVVEPTTPAEDIAAIDYKSKLLALLGLDETADDAAIDAAIEARPDAAALQTQIADLETKLGSATEKISGYEAEAAQRSQAEIDALIAEAGDLPDDAKAALRTALSSDRTSGMALLGAMKKPVAESPVSQPSTKDSQPSEPPPAPTHQPSEQPAPTDEEKVAEQNALIASIRKQGKFKDYTSAREEARRQKPELFS